MQKIYTFLLLLVLCNAATAQNAKDYQFSVESNVALVDMSSGTTLLSANEDEVASGAINFPFVFDNQAYTQVFVNDNGVLTFERPAVFVADNYLSESPVHPIVSVWGDDLYTAENGSVKYKITGKAPARTLVIEWKVKKYPENGRLYNKTFQVWLSERTKKIDLVYGAGFVDEFSGGSVGIGSATSFISVDAITGAASNTAEVVNWGAWPGEGTCYSFSTGIPPVEPLQLGNDNFIRSVSCKGSNNGAITLGTISGGDGNYRVLWQGPNGFTAEGTQLNNLASGSYAYTIKDASQTLEGLVEVKEPEAITLNVQYTNASCVTGLGTITINTNGNYTITDKTGADVTAKSGFAPGTYTVIATKAGGNAGEICTSTPVTITIAAPATFDANITFYPEYTVPGEQAHTIYLGYGPQSVQLSVAGLNDKNYKYNWYPATGLTNANAASTEAAPTTTTTYQVTITNAGGCSITRSVTVNVIDVRSGKKIIICKKGKPSTVEVKDVQRSLDKDAVLGACTDVKPQARAIEAEYENIFATASLKVYPNPSQGKFSVLLPAGVTTASIQVFDVNGRVVKARLTPLILNEPVDFDLSGKPEGLYFIKVLYNHTLQTAKLYIKQ